MLTQGTKYWRVKIYTDFDSEVVEDTWENSVADLHWANKGNVFLTWEEAKTFELQVLSLLKQNKEKVQNANSAN